MTSRPHYWFPAKRYGWGWGLPVRPQGWVVLAAWLVACVAGSIVLAGHPVGFVVFMAVLAAVIVGVCYAKGEPPRWRWS